MSSWFPAFSIDSLASDIALMLGDGEGLVGGTRELCRLLSSLIVVGTLIVHSIIALLCFLSNDSFSLKLGSITAITGQSVFLSNLFSRGVILWSPDLLEFELDFKLVLLERENLKLPLRDD